MNKWDEARERAGKAAQQVAAFFEKNGFYCMLALCVAVIAGTAVYTRTSTPEVTPPPGYEEQDLSAGAQDEGVQTLRDVQASAEPAASPSPAPTVIPLTTSAPAASLLKDSKLGWPIKGEVIREHVVSSIVYLPTLEAWGTHTGMDIAGKAGDAVKAPMSGTVHKLYVDPMWGNVMEITHPGGLTTRYMGLETLTLLKEGDPVKEGQLLSPLGAAPICEQADGAHLHFETITDGEAVDPRTLLTEQ